VDILWREAVLFLGIGGLVALGDLELVRPSLKAHLRQVSRSYHLKHPVVYFRFPHFRSRKYFLGLLIKKLSKAACQKPTK
jgi:hypothetical protein